MCALLWLGWQLARQDREVAAQRALEQRDSAADLSVAALGRALSQLEQRLADLAEASGDRVKQEAGRIGAALPDDCVVVCASDAGAHAFPPRRLPFTAAMKPPTAPRSAAMERAADLEFRRGDYPEAVAALASLARGADARLRAIALLRVARIHKKQGDLRQALDAYEQLRAMGTTPVDEADGLAADLIATEARLAVFTRMEERDAARHEADTVLNGLLDRRWQLTRGAYEFYAAEALRVLGRPGRPVDSAEQLALASVVASLPPGPSSQPSPRRLLVSRDGVAFLVLCRHGHDQYAWAVLGPRWAPSQLPRQPIAIGLTAPDGSLVAGSPVAEPRRETVRLAAVTGLPWNVHAASSDTATMFASSAARRRLLATGLGAITLLFLAGIVLIGRAVSRDLALSRQQSDFVAAVSHDFRTPLSSLCLLSEMLEAGRVASDVERNEYYAVLVREAHRLRRLVEGLLNFGRMEAGAMRYRFDTVDPVELVAEVVEEVQRDVAPRGYRIETSVGSQAPLMRADRAAVGCALWNLLDNAVKYSPDCRAVWVEVDGQDDSAVIRVRDCGVGISPDDHERIFERFVRGRSAGQAEVVGTGVGLALVRHIASAHGGRVSIDSAPGRGSTFTLVLPALAVRRS